MSQELLNEIELEKNFQKVNLERAEALWRLMNNEDFILVFKEYYMGTFLKQLVTDDLASASMEQTKNSAVDKIKAIGLFDQFIKHLDRQGVYAKSFLDTADEELVRIYQENN